MVVIKAMCMAGMLVFNHVTSDDQGARISKQEAMAPNQITSMEYRANVVSIYTNGVDHVIKYPKNIEPHDFMVLLALKRSCSQE